MLTTTIRVTAANDVEPTYKTVRIRKGGSWHTLTSWDGTWATTACGRHELYPHRKSAGTEIDCKRCMAARAK